MLEICLTRVINDLQNQHITDLMKSTNTLKGLHARLKFYHQQEEVLYRSLLTPGAIDSITKHTAELLNVAVNNP